MRRARKRSIAAIGCMLAASAYASTWASPASAFHAGNVFDKPAGAGGGGGIFYTGAASERGWNCNACHTEAAGKIKVTLTTDPPALLQTFRYEPGKTYSFTATLDGEHRGAGASNFNSLAVAFVDPEGGPAGDIGGFAADEFYAGRTTIVSAGQHPGETTWKFRWTAPPQAGAPVKLHLAAVDGNGADGAGGGTLTDPWGDDVFVGSLTLGSGATATAPTRRGGPAGTWIVAVAFAGLLCARRRQGDRR